MPIETAGHVIRRLAMGFAGRENQLRQIEDLEITIETIVIAEAYQSIDMGNATDWQRAGSVNLADLRLVHRALRAVQQLRQTRPDELRIERAGQVDVFITK